MEEVETVRGAEVTGDLQLQERVIDDLCMEHIRHYMKPSQREISMAAESLFTCRRGVAFGDTATKLETCVDISSRIRSRYPMLGILHSTITILSSQSWSRSIQSSDKNF